MARHVRSNFSSEDKAKIFARDRATCCYSGKSLWNLDYGVTPLVQWDWVDHVKPSLRKGSADHKNGVCSSHLFNSKKRANGADNILFFEKGRPTKDFFTYYGGLNEVLRSQLVRLAAVVEEDWYFNRAVSCLWEGCWIHWRMKHEGFKPKERFPENCYSTAKKYLVDYHKKAPSPDFVERGLVLHPRQKDVQILLTLSKPFSDKVFNTSVRRLEHIYEINRRHMDAFWETEDASSMKRRLKASENEPLIGVEVFKAMKSQFEFWRGSKSF